MSLNVIGQRCFSQPEPELGLGIVISVDRHGIGINFPASGEQRRYANGTTILKRVRFREGETIRTSEGRTLTIEAVEETDGILHYVGGGLRVREDAISDQNTANSPLDRLMQAQSDPPDVFTLRYRCLQSQARVRQSPVRGYLGGRIDLIPHQFYILNEVAGRQIPRVLLADEVGLGKTIEACLILQRLLAVGKIRRVLILVPEALVHQWFVELLRRFNLWFSIFDEERCEALEKSMPGSNPFLDEQLALCSVSFAAQSEVRREQMLEGSWDMVVVDEAHHLEWTPEASNPEYDLVEELAARSFGLLLLTATPTQLGMTGHFARLRLLDPNRYRDLETFTSEAKDYGEVAKVADKILESIALSESDRKSLRRLFKGEADRLEQQLKGISEGDEDARSELIRALLDEHGTGRVILRNTRAAMKGFPVRSYRPAPIESPGATMTTRLNRELEAECTGQESAIRYQFRDDPRTEWLMAFLRENKDEKVLLICSSQRKAIALEMALKEATNIKVALFHEGLPLVSRDRQAAWFAEPEGARLMICSEIGSEGRNFQFAHHLVLFDLPLNPGLLEQRIGRLDRIGQTETIKIHYPYLTGSAQDLVQAWYHRGLDALETLIHSGNDYEAEYRDRLLELALNTGHLAPAALKKATEKLIRDTVNFRKQLTLKMQKGRDRLLELNSFEPQVAQRVIEQVRVADQDDSLRELLFDLLDHFGVRIGEHEEGDVFLDPSHAYVEAFPSLPREGTLASFKRSRAIQREDITFITPDHRLFLDTADLLLNSPRGTVSFCTVESDTPNIVLETIHVHEPVTQLAWQVEQFLPPAPIRTVVDIRGRDLTATHELPQIAKAGDEETLRQLLESGGISRDLMKTLLEATQERAEEEAGARRTFATQKAAKILGAEIRRLVELQKINDHVRPEEIALARKELEATMEAIEDARLRLDSLRLILEGPATR